MTPGATMTLKTDIQTITGRAFAGIAALACAGLLLACDGDDEIAAGETPAESPDDDDHGLALAPALAPAADLETDVPVCPDSRVTVLRTTGTCLPTVEGAGGKWNGGPLFVDSAPALAAVCQYTWTPDVDDGPDLDPLEDLPYYAVGSDCEVNWAQSDALSDLLAPGLRDAFYKHIGRLDAAGVPPGAGAPVTVALPDTASTQNVEMNSDHAASMIGIIRSVACPSGALCNLNLERRLALPLIDHDEIDWVHGGFHGSQNHLSQAIHSAITSWKNNPGGGPLIVNLSLGWEPGKFGGGEAPNLMPGPVQGVYRTLQYARCHGALIFAAAGNTSGDDCVDGPLAPALWENVMGPTTTVCKAQYGVTPTWDPSTQPLVHAVAALDHFDRPLQSTRIDGRPRLAAPGFVAVADGPAGLTSATSGSSVATAVLSGTAALLWSRNSGLNAGQVIGRIYASGDPVTPAAYADFGPQGPIRRVSVCEALTQGCSGAACPTVNCGDTTVDVAALASAAVTAAATLPPKKPGLVNASAHVLADVCPAMCSSVKLYTSAAVAGQPGNACEVDLVEGRDRFTDPQPSYPPCKVCFASANKVVMLVEGDFDGLPVTSAVLEVTDGVTTERYQVGPMLAGLSSTERTEVTLPAVIDPLQDKATLHFTFEVTGATPESHSNPISVY
jgi:hypothetical protein